MFKKIDKVFLWLFVVVLIMGIIIFVSASLGVLVKNPSKFYSILISQLVLGLGMGTLAFFLALKIPYKFWQKYALLIFLITLILAALVFVPGLGFRHSDALRWVSLGPISFQPVEFLKFGFIIYFATWMAWAKEKAKDFKFGLLPLICFFILIGFILINEPDIKSFILIIISGFGIYCMSGASWKKIITLGLMSIIALGSIVFFKPYLMDRIETYFEPGRDPRGASYQLEQSLIAFGSGGIFGRGLGQSIQKFNYLPEPQGDSVFAVLGEELGFVGCLVFLMLYLALCLRGLKIGNSAPDMFSRLLVVGIVILITAQGFLNIASVTGVFPLTGVPLPFVSHGGTALMVDLFAMGIVLNVSRQRKII